MTTQTTDPYSQFRDGERPGEAVYEELHALCDSLIMADVAVSEAEELLKKAQEKRRSIAEQQIPELMDKLGLEEFKSKKGWKVTVKKVIRASIPAKFKDKAMKWLVEHGHSGMIKRTISVAFNRDQAELAKITQDELALKFPNVKEDLKVEPATLKAWVTRALDAGEDIPLELFGVFDQKVAKVDLPKST
jgi:hypothetical protein